MKFIVTKASDDEYFKTIELFNLEQLMRFMEKKGDIVIQRNFDSWEDIDDIQKWRGVTKEQAEEIKNIKYNILIYDDYIE